MWKDCETNIDLLDFDCNGSTEKGIFIKKIM